MCQVELLDLLACDRWPVCLQQLPGVTENLSVFGPLNVDSLKGRRRNNLTGKPGSLSGPHFQQRRARSLNIEPGKKSVLCIIKQ